MMKLANTLVGSVALGTALVLLSPADSNGYTFIHSGLNQLNRDFRVYNNFSDSTANDNSVPDAMFPGHTGAVMAIWKACLEWGSELHGDGSGDPLQPFDLGSGGANFDASFQGEADQVGAIDGNTHSELSGSSPGVFAFHEKGGTDGWRIRYYSNEQWGDGPELAVGQVLDLQGIATHEYGHALGLGHYPLSPVSFTMSASVPSGTQGNQMRSIESDDIAGVQALYGVKEPTKPRVTGAVVSGASLTITGANFLATGNEVWFTSGQPGGSGVPAKVVGLASTGGGTEIVVSLPLGAGPGDVLVRTSHTHAGLSNAWPVDTEVGGGPSRLGITSVTPSQLPSLTGSNATSFSLTGNQLGLVSDVLFNGVSLSGLPSSWSYAGNDVIEFDLGPLEDYGVTSLGVYDITVSTSTGTATLPVPVVGASPPALRIGGGNVPELVLSSFDTDIVMGGQPGNAMLLFASVKHGLTPFPGLFDLELGDSDYASIFFVGAFAIGANGNVTATPNFSPSLAGTTIFWDAVEYDPLTGTLPLASTNIAECLILF